MTIYLRKYLNLYTNRTYTVLVIREHKFCNGVKIKLTPKEVKALLEEGVKYETKE